MQFIVRVALSQFDYINYMLITITIEMHACMHICCLPMRSSTLHIFMPTTQRKEGTRTDAIYGGEVMLPTTCVRLMVDI